MFESFKAKKAARQQAKAQADEAAKEQKAEESLDEQRRNLEALIDRKSFYRLIELGQHADHDGASWFGLWSGGTFFPVIPSAELG